MVHPGDDVALVESEHPFVGRGGLKLDHALEVFGVDVAARTALDAGASTGGFTDCLLQRGARSVVAVDVGYGQLHWKLRSDPRVVVVERTNVRLADPEVLGAPFQIVVADLSFISLRAVLRVLARCGAADTDWVLLVKPQFEVGRERVGAGGIVTDVSARVEAVLDVVGAAGREGLVAVGVTSSPITGASGNVEFLLHLRREGEAMTPDAVKAIVEGSS